MKSRRIYWTIGLEYRTTHDQLRKIRDEIEKYLTDNGNFVKSTEQPLFVRIEKFSDSSIDLLVYCFATTTNWGRVVRDKRKLSFRD